LCKRVFILFVAAAILIMSAPTFADSVLFYTVKPEDTVWKISKKFGVSMESILRNNSSVKNEKDLQVGMTLIIPDKSDQVVPVEEGVTQTRTLIVHGSGGQYSPPTEQSVNIMTVGSKKIKVPEFKKEEKEEDSKTYRSKYHKLSSRRLKRANTIVKTAFKFMGVPYVFGGSTPNGFDCSGFVQYVFRLNGIKVPRMAHHQYYAGTPIKKSQIRPGDLVFFETYTAGISHVGIYIGNSRFIHASSRGAVRINSLKERYYTNRYRGAARYY